ncbi:hypothetical protein JQX13_40450 [Archangium violaceum]|uniref:hypothetical protein n=1 Tax=Archangium violaceum TaxID=83451 RepID=UPI00193C1E1C|nr:hypothetical protein [Archangium violaceum]QRK06318.1 hypothetical protein JQX13_40450 [Archangium violaceum]
MKTLTQFIVPLLLGLLTACGNPNAGPVTISPKTATMNAGEKLTFTATVKDAKEPRVLWSVEGGDAHGTITSTGVYTAPSEPGTYTVVATNAVDTSKKDTATVTVPGTSGVGYQDPTGTGWRFVKNTSASTDSRLVLDLVGPADQSGRGVGLTLSVDPTRASWAKVSDADTEYVTNRLFELGAEPRLFKSNVKEGTLTVGVFQKGTLGPATAYSGALLSVALDLKTGPSTPAGTLVPISVVKAHALSDSGALGAIDVAVGTLTTR